MDLLVKVNVVKVVKVKVKFTFTTPLVKVKAKVNVLYQPFGKGGEGGKGKCSLALTDVVPPNARLGSLQHSSLPHSLTPGGRPFRISLRLMNQARIQ